MTVLERMKRQHEEEGVEVEEEEQEDEEEERIHKIIRKTGFVTDRVQKY